jgi:hypothetical protein
VAVLTQRSAIRAIVLPPSKRFSFFDAAPNQDDELTVDKILACRDTYEEEIDSDDDVANIQKGPLVPTVKEKPLFGPASHSLALLACFPSSC